MGPGGWAGSPFQKAVDAMTEANKAKEAASPLKKLAVVIGACILYPSQQTISDALTKAALIWDSYDAVIVKEND